MTSGGFAYESVRVTYQAADYGTTYDWALALHRARVTAFLRASFRAYEMGGGFEWDSMDPASYGSSRAQIVDAVEYDPSGYPGLTKNVFIQDVNGSAQTSYPAFVTVFENAVTSAQFAIITSRGFHNNTSWIGDPTRGFYIPGAKCMTNGYSRRLPVTFAHVFAANGIGSFNAEGEVDANYSPSAAELPVCPSYGLYASDSVGSQSTASNSSCLTTLVGGTWYLFGYAVKGYAIEGFFKNSAYPNGTGSAWDISGHIFDGDPGWDEGAGTFSGTCFGYYSPYIANLYDYTARSLSDNISFAGSFASVDALDSAQHSYMQAVLQGSGSVQCYPAMSPGYLPMRSASNIGDKIVWSAGCVAWSVAASYNAIRNLPSIDGQGNSVKGFLRDDIFRFVSIFATRIGGTTFQGGNFIGMNCGQQSSGFEVGVLLGWDGSNANDIL